jgi:hypothetical protein
VIWKTKEAPFLGRALDSVLSGPAELYGAGVETLVIAAPDPLLLAGLGSLTDWPGVTATEPSTLNMWSPAPLQTTNQLRMIWTEVLAGSDLLAIVTTRLLFGTVQPAGRVSEKVVSTLTLATGPLLCSETTAETGN